ncbi:MAG TPA: M23 family metallopeptidase, partial [Bacteroidia bacterium]
MSSIRYYIFSFLFVFSLISPAQTDFRLPLDKIVVTGNFCEIRPNHFHAGLDLRTDASKNLPIYSIADGYVSRIKISTYGYGHVIYITHEGGYVSVYAHQHHFSDKLEKHMRKKQKEEETFELELFPGKDELPIKKGEIIGYTGNTGSSQAPHLHFEIRDEKTEAALNPFKFFNLTDTVAPVIDGIYFYDTNDLNNAFVIDKKKITEEATKDKTKKGESKSEQLALRDTFVLPECFGFGFSAFDRHIKNGNQNQILSAELFLDEKIFYKHSFDTMAFDKSKYINCFTDLSKDYKKERIQKCFLSKNDFMGIFSDVAQTGEVFLKDTLVHTIKLICKDVLGNKETLTFKVKRQKVIVLAEQKKYKYDCLKELVFEDPGMKLIFPEKCFFNDFNLYYTKSKKPADRNSVHVFGVKTAMYQPCSIYLKNNLPKIDTSKLCIVEATSGTYCGGKLQADGFVFGTC